MNWVCIDFGTCNSAAAIEIDGTAHIVTYVNQQFFPSIACVLDDGNIEVCQNAEAYRLSNPETFIQEFKLNIADPVDINSKSYEDIITAILSFIKGCAESENNGHTIDNVILTIPVIYTAHDPRKTVMTNSAKRAGFKQIEFLSEPQAAALHYADISGSDNVGLSLIYDLGGGTFDPALLEIKNKSVKLLGHETGINCGGHFFDKAIYYFISTQAREKNNPLLRNKRLDDYASCRRIKEELSINDNATQLFSNGVKYSISRETFNDLIKDHINLTLQACDKLISTAGKQWSDLRQILLVGGSTAIPLISDQLSKHRVSHNAPNIKIIRNAKGKNGKYNHRFATCMGGISSKILPPPPPPEKIASVSVNGQLIQLHQGENTFGRDSSMNFTFNDLYMSRHHFTITVTKSCDNKYNYVLTTKSQTKATILNNYEALELRYAPISRISVELQDNFTITAGKTKFIFQKS